MFTLTDLQTLAGVAMQVDSSPAVLAGRVLGLTPEEQRTAPKWGWWALGIGGAVAVGLVLHSALASRKAAADEDEEDAEEDDEDEDEDDEDEEPDDEDDSEETAAP